MSYLYFPSATPAISSHRASFSGSFSLARTRSTFCRATSVTFSTISGTASSAIALTQPRDGSRAVMIPGVARVLLLLPSGTYKAPDFLAAAGRLGVDVVVASETAQTLAEAMGDRALVVDLADPEGSAAAVTALAARRPLDAVIAVDDQGVLIAALAAQELGLPANAPEAVARTRN